MNSKIKTVIAILVLLNIVLMAFLYLGRPNRGMHHSPKMMIVEKLGFDESQTQEFEALISEHQVEINSLQNKVRENKTLLYKGIANNNKTYNDSIISLIGKKFEEIEQVHYKHFLGIKKICKADQKVKFDELAKEFNQLFGPPKLGPGRK